MLKKWCFGLLLVSGVLASGCGGDKASPYSPPPVVPASVDEARAISAVIEGAGRLVAVGDRGLVMTSSDGNIWTEQSSKTVQDLTGIAFSGESYVGVGKSGTIVASRDGIIWEHRKTIEGRRVRAGFAPSFWRWWPDFQIERWSRVGSSFFSNAVDFARWSVRA
jgi:photosystem II stability/assembly factor-like uncharacterized protein